MPPSLQFSFSIPKGTPLVRQFQKVPSLLFHLFKTILHINVRPKILVVALPCLSAVKRLKGLPNTCGLMQGFVSLALTLSILDAHHFEAVDFLSSLNRAPPFAPPTYLNSYWLKFVSIISESRNTEKIWKYHGATMPALISPLLEFFFMKQKKKSNNKNSLSCLSYCHVHCGLPATECSSWEWLFSLMSPVTYSYWRLGDTCLPTTVAFLMCLFICFTCCPEYSEIWNYVHLLGRHYPPNTSKVHPWALLWWTRALPTKGKTIQTCDHTSFPLLHLPLVAN